MHERGSYQMAHKCGINSNLHPQKQHTKNTFCTLYYLLPIRYAPNGTGSWHAPHLGIYRRTEKKKKHSFVKTQIGACANSVRLVCVHAINGPIHNTAGSSSRVTCDTDGARFDTRALPSRLSRRLLFSGRHADVLLLFRSNYIHVAVIIWACRLHDPRRSKSMGGDVRLMLFWPQAHSHTFRPHLARVRALL